MSFDLDPSDGLPSRAAIARELLYRLMREYSGDFHCAGWLSGLEFVVWDFAHNPDRRNTGNAEAESLARWFRNLATIADGWWVGPKPTDEHECREAFIPLAEWKECLEEGT
jgi:hypothetical protein